MNLRLREIYKYIPAEVALVSSRLKEAGHQVYLVGGAIRDLILGIQPTDWDFATSAKPDQVEQLFEKTIPTGKAYGTITVVGEAIDISTREEKLLGKLRSIEPTYQVTTFRNEADYSDNRHPDQVEYISSLRADLTRRDFTINAIAYSIDERELIDYFDGIDALKYRMIATVGDPRKRFREDSLRLWRACRFAAQLGFTIEPVTWQELQVLGKDLPLPALERVQMEFDKIIRSPHPAEGLQLLADSALLGRILPEYDYRKSAQLLTDSVALQGLKREVRLAALLQPYPAEEFLRNLRYPNKDIDWILKLIKFNLNEEKAGLTVKDLKITGIDLMELGLRGEAIGQMQNLLLEKVLEQPVLNRKRKLLEMADEFISVGTKTD